MRALLLTVIVAGLLPLQSCIDNKETLNEKWQDIKARASYASYCDMDVCDDVEQGAEPPCDCWCDYDGGDDGAGGSGGDDTGTCGDGQDDVGGNCGGGDESGGGDEGSSGCTLTQGYWKNHNELQSNRSQAVDWPAPMDERDQLCGQSLLDILNTAPRGIAWTILAHQAIAASLNAAAGASTGGGVADAISEAEALLTSNCGGISGPERERALELSELLDAYNNGLLGPAHCN